MPITIEPHYHRILARRLDPSTRTAGGIIIPDQAQAKHHEAVVVATGPGKPTDDGKWVPTGVEVGDHVLFENGKDFTLEGEPYIFLTPIDVLGKVHRTPAETKKEEPTST